MPFIDKKEFFTVCKSNEYYCNKITELCHVHDSKAFFNETQMMVAFSILLLDDILLEFCFFQVRFLVSFLWWKSSLKNNFVTSSRCKNLQKVLNYF
jgi:hypothetical protein